MTNKQSNIIQDISTLHLFARCITEECGAVDAAQVKQHAFELIFAFDEIITSGHVEPVTLTDIRTFLEMDSHEEKMQEMLVKSKELEAKETAKLRAKELEMQRREAARKAAMMGSSSASLGGNRYMAAPISPPASSSAPPQSTYAQPPAAQ